MLNLCSETQKLIQVLPDYSAFHTCMSLEQSQWRHRNFSDIKYWITALLKKKKGKQHLNPHIMHSSHMVNAVWIQMKYRNLNQGEQVMADIRHCRHIYIFFSISSEIRKYSWHTFKWGNFLILEVSVTCTWSLQLDEVIYIGTASIVKQSKI